METIDHLIHAKWIITCEEQNQILSNHALAIKNNKILAILPSEEVKSHYQAREEHHYLKHAVLPGFINAHTHLAMSLFKGLADDLDLMDWLTNYIWPAERKWISEEFVRDGSKLAMAEMIHSGTTCFNDMYFFLQTTAEAAEAAGLRAHIGITIIDFPTQWAKNVDEYFAKGLEFLQQYQHHELITPTLAPQGAYTVKEKDLARVKTLADQYNLRVNIHCQEALSDIEGAIKLNGKRPLECLDAVGLVSPNLIAIHMTQLNDNDFALLQAKKPHIVHCPESNMKLASGICPVTRLQNMGINVALGSDGAASNNDLDMIGEMRSAAFLAKIAEQNPKTLPAEAVLKMATLNGAKALGIDHLTGSLTKGKAADFIAINLEDLDTQPLYHPISQIVYGASRHQVTDMWVNGKQLMRNRQLLTLDEKSLLATAKTWQKKLMT